MLLSHDAVEATRLPTSLSMACNMSHQSMMHCTLHVFMQAQSKQDEAWQVGRPVATGGPPGPGACAKYGHLCQLDAAHMPCAAEHLWAAGDVHLQSCFLEEVHRTHAHGMVFCSV